MFLNKRLFDSKYTLPRSIGAIYTADDYKALPKSVRELNGWYLVPLGLECKITDFKKRDSEWDKFYKFIRQEYPIQWLFRHWLISYENPVYAFAKIQYMKYLNVKYAIKRYINPLFPRWRKSCKRHAYKDICSLVVDSNFALILDFWYEEVVDGNVNWQSDSDHKQFYNQLKANVDYIETKRLKLQDKSEKELSKATKKKKGLSYEERYGKYNIIEEEIANKDTEVLLWFIENRNFFWT